MIALKREVANAEFSMEIAFGYSVERMSGAPVNDLTGTAQQSDDKSLYQ